MRYKILRLIIAPLVGLFTTILFLQVHSSFVHYQYPNHFDDEPLALEPLFDFAFFAPTYGIIWLVALLFQYLIVLKVWNIYLQRNRLLGVNLFTLVLVASIAFGLCMALVNWQYYTGLNTLFSLLFMAIIVAGLYFTSNLAVLYIIEKVKA